MAPIATTTAPDRSATVTTARVLRRPLAAGLLSLALYVALSFANDPKGYLGTDTGGKVATLRMMSDARAA